MSQDPLDRVSPDSASTQRSGSLARGLSLVSLVIALLIGIQLGAIPWRYRRQIWQLQGFLLGAVVGYMAGRINGRDSSSTPPPLQSSNNEASRLP